VCHRRVGAEGGGSQCVCGTPGVSCVGEGAGVAVSTWVGMGMGRLRVNMGHSEHCAVVLWGGGRCLCVNMGWGWRGGVLCECGTPGVNVSQQSTTCWF
jgi:hypothetical protein